jgi:hypothetical protein
MTYKTYEFFPFPKPHTKINFATLFINLHHIVDDKIIADLFCIH